MTVIQWNDGDILTAGSLRLIPQHYQTINPETTFGQSGTNYVNVGSIFVSGNTFGESLLVYVNTNSLDINSAQSYDIWGRILTSGPGLGGGSAIASGQYYSQTSLSPCDNWSPFIRIPSSAGWIPGSDCVVFYQIRATMASTADAFVRFRSMSLWGTGKP